jgi:hypothetical protein
MLKTPWNRGSSVGVVTMLQAGRSGVQLPTGTKIFLLCSERPDRTLDSPSLLSNGYWAFFSGGRAAGA